VKQKRLYIILLFAAALYTCKRPKPLQLIEGYNYSPNGYHYKLISFTEGNLKPKTGEVVWLDVEFRTQSDSLFWDSRHDMRNRFFFKLQDSLYYKGFIKHLHNMVEGDSMAYYFKVKPFFKMYFKTDSIPFFSRNDSMVKANVKLRKVMDETEFSQLSTDLDAEEKREIRNFLESNNLSNCADSLGIKWLAFESTDGIKVEQGKTVVISYKGYFLDGKLIDYSEGNFTYVYGTPDQLLKGLNSVIGRLKNGEFIKIILSSCLAFGKTGSSNGTVPPFTPLLYEIKLIEVK
jgi:FKBP-type peptidyl-prolyl cis-trans isomerase FkpA